MPPMNEEKLATDNLKLVYHVIFKTFPIPPGVLDFDDMVQEGCIALVNAARTYDGSTKFSTYAVKCIRNHFIKLYAYYSRQKRYAEQAPLSLDDVLEYAGKDAFKEAENAMLLQSVQTYVDSHGTKTQ